MKKNLVILTAILAFAINSFAQITPDISSWIRNTTNQLGYGGIPSNVQTVQYDTTNTYVSCTCIPGYSIGPWTGNPNIPSNQNFVFAIPRHPHHDTSVNIPIGLGHIGIWSNGVSIFNVSDAMSYNNYGYWNRNAYFWEGPGFDACLGHPQQQGEYHHHVSPSCLYNQQDSIHHSPIIGFSFDGFPVYGAWAYQDTNGTGPFRRMRSSYQLRNITNRDTLPDGTGLTSTYYGPVVSSTYPLGAYIEDYKYVAGSGDLDARNGRFCVTPDYPQGIYCYFVTIDSAFHPVFPYTYYGSYYGVVPAGDMGMGSGHVTITDSTTVYNPTGIPELQRHIQFEFNPNPVKEYAYIYFNPNSSNNIRCSVYDSKGKCVESFNTMQPSISYAFDFTKYATGIYFLHLETANEKVVQKFVKVK